MAKKVFTTLVGLALVLGYWTLRDKIGGSASAAASDRLPSKVWEGGGTTVTIDVESSEPAVMRAFFTSTTKNSGVPVRSLDTYEKVAAGSHSWTIDVPAAVGADLELKAVGPKAGSRLTWTIRSGGRVLAQNSESLDAPPRGDEVFCLNFDAEDFATVQQ